MLKIAGFICIALLILFGCVRLALDSLTKAALAKGQVNSALKLSPHDADTLAAAAANSFDAKDYKSARQFALAALQESPLDAKALRVLGETEEAEKHIDRAIPIMVLAGQMGWRDTRTQLWLFRQSVLAGDVESAMQRADALLRREKAPAEIFRFLALSTTVPQLRSALLVRLLDMPAWRVRFFQSASEFDANQLRGIALLVLELQKAAGDVTDLEVGFVTSAMVGKGLYPEAYAVWRAMRQDRGENVRVSVIGGNFEGDGPSDDPSTRSPFDWNLVDNSDLAAIEASPAGGGLALRLSADGEEMKQPLATKFVVLPPGDRVVRFFVQEEEPGGGRAVQVSVRCPSGAVLGAQGLAVGGERKIDAVQLRVTIPPVNCPAQILSFEPVPAAKPNGAVWVDDVVVE